MAWFSLFLAGFFEAGWLVFLDKSQSFTRVQWVVLAAVSMVLSLVLFAFSIREIPTHVAYLVWLAVGVGSLTVLKIAVDHQPINPVQIGCLLLIAIGIVGLKWAG